MDLAWYCRVGERQVGPISMDQLRRMAARGDLKLTSLVRRQDVNSWIEAGQLPELWPRAEALPPEPGMAPGPGGPRPAGPIPVVPRAAGPVPVAPAASGPVIPRAIPVPAPGPGQNSGPASVPGHGLAPSPRPVAMPIGPQPVPVGRGPVPVPVSRGSVPVGPVPVGPVPVGPVPVGPVPVGPQSAALGSDRQAKAEQRRREARKKLYLLIGGTGGLILLLGVIGVVMSAGRNPNSEAGSGAQVAANAVDAAATNPVASGSTGGAVSSPVPATSTASAPPTAPGGLVPPAASVGAAVAKSVPAASAPAVRAVPAVPAAAKGKMTENVAARSSAAIEQILRTTQPWRNLSSVNSVSSRQSRVQITGVWFAPLSSGAKAVGSGNTAKTPASSTNAGATNAGGNAAVAGPAVDVVAELLKGSQAVSPKPDAGAAGAAGAVAAAAPDVVEAAAPTPAPGNLSGPRVVCVEVRVTNPDQSGAPLNYLSWNQTPAKAGSPPVVLVDSTKQPLPLVPKAKFSDPARRETPLRLAPGQGVTDLLVFEAPAGEFEHLRLALRLSAMGQGDRYLGFEVPREMVADSRPEELVESVPSRGGTGAAGGTARAGAAGRPANEPGDDPAAMPPPGPPMPREETILDLKKQIEDAAKKTKAEKAMELKKRDEEDRKKEAAGSPNPAAPQSDAGPPAADSAQP